LIKEQWLESTRAAASADWFEGPLGARVLREETALARFALDDVFGFELLQVGAWGPSRHLLKGARTQHVTLVAPEAELGTTLCAPLDSLPFSSDSIDAIFLPHTLELVEDPYAVLREAERVLCAEGCLMICGFNPFSGWGLRRPPRTRRMLSEQRLRDWVALLGLDIDGVYGYLGLLPISRVQREADYRPRTALTAGAYLLKARKRMPTMTLVRPKRRALQRVLVGAAEPSRKLGQYRDGA
jgi:SAM-dependent methyltransferase